MSAHDPAAALARVEREIAALSRKLERGRAELATLRAHGPEPRGLLAGAIAGMMLAVIAFVAFACWASILAPPRLP